MYASESGDNVAESDMAKIILFFHFYLKVFQTIPRLGMFQLVSHPEIIWLSHGLGDVMLYRDASLLMCQAHLCICTFGTFEAQINSELQLPSSACAVQGHGSPYCLTRTNLLRS